MLGIIDLYYGMMLSILSINSHSFAFGFLNSLLINSGSSSQYGTTPLNNPPEEVLPNFKRNQAIKVYLKLMLFNHTKNSKLSFAQVNNKNG